MEKKLELLINIRSFLKGRSDKLFSELLRPFHLHDVAITFEQLNFDEQIKLIRLLPEKQIARIFEYVSLPTLGAIFSYLKVAKGCSVLVEMVVDEALKVLKFLEEENAHKYKTYVIGLEKNKKGQTITDCLEDQAAETAAAMMHTNFYMLSEKLSVQEAIDSIKEKKFVDHHVAFYLFIVTDDNTLKGYVNLRQLLINDPQESVKSLIKEAVYVLETEDVEEVARIVRRYDLVVLPVVNDHNELVGVITEDDVVDVVVEEATEDLYRLSGTTDIEEDELINGSLLNVIRSRIPWLLLSMVGGLFGVVIMSYFESLVIPKQLNLGMVFGFVPLIMGLSGNIANQSATIVVRALSTGTLSLESVKSFMGREMTVGLILGLCLQILISIILWVFKVNPVFIFWIAVTVCVNSLFSVFIGGALPFLFKLMKIDPAISSAPFISTTLDILGQLSYFFILYTFWINA